VDMHLSLRPLTTESGGSNSRSTFRLNSIEIDGVLHDERVRSAEVVLGEGPAQIAVEFLTETPVVFPVAKGQRNQLGVGFHPGHGTFDSETLIHPVADGWKVAADTAPPYVSRGMWQHCEDCDEPALFRCPWVQLGAQRTPDFVSVQFYPAEVEMVGGEWAYTRNGSGEIVRGSMWVARVELLGTVDIDPIDR
jgi:hypothetical protein